MADPSVDPARWLARLDDLASAVDGRGVDAVCRLLFVDLGFTGDRDSYDDPANSYLDQVIERRRGIPITLSVLLMEVARRCGARLEAVGMPGHVLVRDRGRPEALIDAFDGGTRLDWSATEALLRSVAGPGASLVPSMLAPVGPRAILLRMLANLDRSFASRGDHDGVGWVCGLRAAVPAAPAADRAQLAARLADLGRFDVAARVLEDAAPSVPEGPLRTRMLSDAVGLRARLN